MIIPKEIVEKMEKVNELQEEIFEWAKENIDIEGSDLSFDEYEKFEPTYIFTNKPTGVKQSTGEYCNQWEYAEDWYVGNYYYPTFDGRYLKLDYDI